RQPAFFYDGGLAIPGSGAVALPASGPYLAGVLNSRLIAFVFAKTASMSGRKRAEYSWDDLRYLPVYTPDFDDPADAGRHDRIVSLVTRVLDLKKQVSRAETDEQCGTLREKIEAADRKINRIVYDLYGVSEEEIAVAEEEIPISAMCGGHQKTPAGFFDRGRDSAFPSCPSLKRSYRPPDSFFF